MGGKRVGVRSLMLVLPLLSAMPESASSGGLAGSEWRPVRIGNRVPDDAAGIFVKFGGEGRLSGHAGCNRFFGSYEINDDRIRMGPMGTTRMACAQDVMALERSFLQALEAAKGFERNATRFTLTDGKGARIAEFIQTDWD